MRTDLGLEENLFWDLFVLLLYYTDYFPHKIWKFAFFSISAIYKLNYGGCDKNIQKGLPKWCSSKESTCQFKKCKRHGFNPWVGKILWNRAWQPTSVFLPGESPWTEEPGGLQSRGLQRVGHSWTTKHSTFSLLIMIMSNSSFFHVLIKVSMYSLI